MSIEITGFAESNIGNIDKKTNDDFATYDVLETAAGLLHVGIVCDGVSNADWGVRASKLAAETVLYVLATTQETKVPRMLVEALQVANHEVVTSLSGRGVTTVAVAIIHMNGADRYGRLYIASAGDSPIILYEAGDKGAEGRLTRLNIDHNQATADYIEGKISNYEREFAQYTSDGAILINALGIADDRLQADLGIYFERFSNASDVNEARKRGLDGIPLKEGDTIIVCTDGLTDLGDDDEPYVSPEMFIRHAQDIEVDRATRTLVGYAVQNGTHDNASLAMLFVPSKYRKNVLPMGETRVPWRIIAMIAVVAILLIGGIGYIASTQISESNKEADESKKEVQIAQNDATRFAQATSTAIFGANSETKAAIDATSTASVLTATAVEENSLATSTALADSGQATANAIGTSDAIATATLEAIAQSNIQATENSFLTATVFQAQTATADYFDNLPTVTPTPRPSFETTENVLGVIYALQNGEFVPGPLFEETEITADGETLIIVDGGVDKEDPARFYMTLDSAFEIDKFDDEERAIDILVGEKTDIFAESGYYAGGEGEGGITLILIEDRNVSFSSQGACVGVEYEDPIELSDTSGDSIEGDAQLEPVYDTVIFSCFGDDDNCVFQEDQPVEKRISIVWNLDEEEIIEERAIDYEMANRFYELYASYYLKRDQEPEIPTCLGIYLDIDEDGFRDEDEDQCPTLAGLINGCPDSDSDGVPDPRDECPTAYGTHNGCPASPTPSARPSSTATNVPPTGVPPTKTPVPTNTPLPTATNTPVPPTNTFTFTPVPPTNTFTFTPVPPTNTFTFTPVPPTNTFTFTPVPPTNTFTFTPVPPTDTPVPPTETPVPPSNTPEPPPPSETPPGQGTPGGGGGGAPEITGLVHLQAILDKWLES